MIPAFLTLLRQELRLQLKQRAAWVTLVLFFLLVILLLPFALGPEPEILRRLAAGLIWLATLLMNLLALERLFGEDARDGTLDLMLLSPLPLPLLVGAKLLAHTAIILSALAVMLPAAALLLNLDVAMLPTLAFSLLLGVPLLLALGAVMAAVTLAVKRGAALLALLLIPFYIPVMIFGVGASDAAALGANPAPHLLLLAALLVFTLPAALLLVTAALRQAQA